MAWLVLIIAILVVILVIVAAKTDRPIWIKVMGFWVHFGSKGADGPRHLPEGAKPELKQVESPKRGRWWKKRDT